MVNAQNKDVSFDGIHIVQEYPKMFPEDVLGLPLDRVKFATYLVPGAGLVYKTAPAKLSRAKRVEVSAAEIIW